MDNVMENSEGIDSENKDQKYNANDLWYKSKEPDRMKLYGVKPDCN